MRPADQFDPAAHECDITPRSPPTCEQGLDETSPYLTARAGASIVCASAIVAQPVAHWLIH